MHPFASSDPIGDQRYPIGPLDPASSSTGPEERRAGIEAIAELPERFSVALAGLDQGQIDTPYREGGWTLRQLAHHVADSHMNAYTRLKLALTEDWPVIKPYEEALWAELADSRTLPVELSLSLLTPLHARWVALLHSLDEAAWHRGYVHPVSGRTAVASIPILYGWHGRHHTAHALALRERLGW